MKAGSWHGFPQCQGRALSRGWAQPPEPWLPHAGVAAPGDKWLIPRGSCHARSSLTADSESLLHPQSCKRPNTSELKFLPSSAATTPAAESWSPTQNPRPPSTGAIHARSHHLAPVLCCSTQHCWEERALQLQPLLSPASPLRAVQDLPPPCFRLYPRGAAPELGLAQNQTVGRTRVEDRG